jgi:hypothetical protein
VQTFCISAINQFIFLGNPSDIGKGEFVPMAFAVFVASMARLDCTVNVFFDETLLPDEQVVRTHRWESRWCMARLHRSRAALRPCRCL